MSLWGDRELEDEDAAEFELSDVDVPEANLFRSLGGTSQQKLPKQYINKILIYRQATVIEHLISKASSWMVI